MTSDQKKRLEVAACESVASEINRLRGADFRAEAGTSEPVDVFLVSPSKKLPDRSAQVVSVPRDIHHRDDNHNLERIKRDLERALSERRIRGIYVGVLPDAKAVERGARPELLAQIADIVSSRKNEEFRIQYHELLELAPEVAEYFHQFFVSPLPEQDWTVVDVAGPGGALPQDGRWIAQGIDLKLAKYGGPKQVAGLTLVIDACGFVTDEQVSAFRKAHPPESLPFAEIWITGSPAGTVCLKPHAHDVRAPESSSTR